MRVHLFSDLHLEYGPLELPEAVRTGALAELVLLAGDIDVKRRAVAWAAATFCQRCIIIGGNHEPYGDSLYANIAANRVAADKMSLKRDRPLRFLEREVWTSKAGDGTPVRVVAATLWTNFEAFSEITADRAMFWAQREMNDYREIRIRDEVLRETRKLQPVDILRINTMSREFLESTLAEPFDGITIVMTHHAPSLRNVPQEYKDVRAFYASDYDALIERFQPALWVHGHYHNSVDYFIGDTRIVCNPRGYFPHWLNFDFDPQLVIEI